jgi:ribonuclease HI
MCNFVKKQALKVRIFTDGSSKGNPGPGGYGAILKFNDQVKELSQGYRKTTNNRMELMALIVALENMKTNKFPIEVYSDSKYVIDAITKGWVFGWRSKGFKGKKNGDLWMRYLDLHPRFHLTFHWVKGHAGHPENERCDYLAVKAAETPPHHIDSVFEANEENGMFD